VVDVVVVEVDGALDQAEPEPVEAEVEILLRVVDGGGDVVEAKEAMSRHGRNLLPETPVQGSP
jgi:hypothetical protein